MLGLTTTGTSKVLGVSVDRVKDMLEHDRLSYQRAGRIRVIDPATVEAYRDSRLHYLLRDLQRKLSA